MQAETSGAAFDGRGLKWRRVRQRERPRRRGRELLHHWFSDGWSARIDAYGLCTSCGIRFRKNWLRYEGVAIPSSESLTHAAIYESDASTSAVIHCHDSGLWATLLDRAPTTSKSVAYGSPEMAYEVMRLFKGTDLRSRKILMMAGHEGGIATFGKNLEDAFDVVMRERRESSPCI
jgi:Class II Aldolase and Adducin N-terminal domain